MNNKRFKYQKGFTLIEILTVIALSSFLFITIFGLYFRIKDLIYDQGLLSQKKSHAFSVIEMISNDLRNLYYEKWNKNSFFEGEKAFSTHVRIDTLNFVSSTLYSNASTMQNRVFSINYFGEENEDGHIYLFRQESAFLDYKEKNWGIPIPILKDVILFEVNYSSNGTQWEEEWNLESQRKLPGFVRIRIRWLEVGEEKEHVVAVQPYIAGY